MPITYHIDTARRLILTTGEGHVIAADVTAHQNRLLHDPAFNANFNQLIDVRPVTKLDISAEEARAIARRRIVSPKSRRAYVATDPSMFGMGRLMEAYHELAGEAAVQVFYDFDLALDWLGVRRKLH